MGGGRVPSVPDLRSALEKNPGREGGCRTSLKDEEKMETTRTNSIS